MALEKQANRDWTTGYCGRVDCFNYCLDRFGEQWTALQATHHGPTGLLLLHKELLRDRTEYGDVANWITHAVEYLNLKKGNTIPPEKLWLVVQGYDVTSQDEKVARRAALKIGAGSVLVARTRIDQSYEPHLMPVKGK